MATTVVLGAMAGPLAGGAFAQATRPVAVSEAVTFAIPSQPLSGAIDAFIRATGWQISYSSELVRGKRSNSVEGRLSPEAALRALIVGTGLEMRVGGAGSAALVDPGTRAVDTVTQADGSIQLSRIDVTGRVRSGWEPVEGFVAEESLAATKTDTPILETPQSVYVVGREQMDVQDAETVPQALRYTPGILTERNGADERTDFIYSRGFEIDEYLDGTRIVPGVWTTPKVEAFGLERIDVMKGPASVLYGQGSPGGVASLISKRPTAEPYREVSVEAGNYESFRGTIDLSGPLDADGRLLYRLTGLVRDADTQVDGVEEQRYFVAPALTWRPTEDTTLDILTQYMRDPDVGLYYKLPAVGTLLPNPNGRIPTSFRSGDPSFDRQERTQYSAGYNFEHRFSDALKFRQNGRFTRVEGDYAILVVGNLQADQHTIDRSAYTAVESTNTFSVDTNLQGKLSTGPFEHTILGGVDYQLLNSDRVDGFGSAPPIDYLNPIYNQTIPATVAFLDNNQKNEQIGIYLQDQIDFGNLSLVVGGRHDWAWSDTLDYLYGSETKQDDAAFTGRAGLIYTFDSGIAPYVSYSESFEPEVGTTFDGTPFDPTTGQQYEAGLKYQRPGTNSFFGASLYEIHQQNVPTADPDPAHLAIDPFAQVQSGEVVSRGVELEANVELTDGLHLIATYAYLDAEITKSNDGLEGFAPVYQPKNMASAWLDYQFASGPLDGLGVGVGVRYVGESYGDAANTLVVPAYTLLDASLRYDVGAKVAALDGLELSLNGKNLLDEVYVSGCQNINTCYYGQRRLLSARLSYRW
ncbi:TonB-dependent siderophore receptor [Amorphus sp. 3PC139-8]|uniref:TonB-dependent siderophore receptor n=1 Tax=Amorphus sp. 3PC139-8 TaxID=2735676 RepID=UPI00345CAA22